MKNSVTINFQFHRRSIHAGGVVWIAEPRPRSLVWQKAAYYESWQREERQRLEAAGEIVMMHFRVSI